MKKLIYILLGLFALVSCIDDQSDLGGDAISRLSFVNPLDSVYVGEKMHVFTLNAPDIVQENEDKPLFYEWQVDHEVKSTSNVLTYECTTCGTFLCRLKVYNEDGAIFKTFNLKVPYPYEDGIVVLSLHDGKSMVSFKNIEGGDRVFEKGVYRLNNPGVTLGNAPRSILYNAKSNYIYIATEEPLKIAKVEANSMEILNMINCPEPRVERLLPNGESTITFLGGGRIADMNCQGEDFLNNFQQGITNAMMGGMFPDAYLANQAIISYSYSGTSYLVFDTRDKLFLAPGDWGMVMPVYDELEAVSVLGMLNSKNDGEGLIIMKDVANQMKVVYVNAKNSVLKSVWPETKGNIVENSVILTSMKESILYYSKGNEIFRYNFESDGNFPSSSDYTVGEDGDVIKGMVLDPQEKNLYVALDAAGNQEYKGCVYCYDVATKSLKWKERGVAGEIVQMIYKEQKQTN